MVRWLSSWAWRAGGDIECIQVEERWVQRLWFACKVLQVGRKIRRTRGEEALGLAAGSFAATCDGLVRRGKGVWLLLQRGEEGFKSGGRISCDDVRARRLGYGAGGRSRRLVVCAGRRSCLHLLPISYIS